MKWIEVLIGTRGDGKSLLPGGIYEISDGDADILIRNKRAKPAVFKKRILPEGSVLSEADFETSMESVGDQKNRFKGRPAVILGAGPSLPDQIHMIPENALKISINERPPRLVECDYVVFFDFNTIPLLSEIKAKKISPFNGYSEFWIDSDVWFNGWSGSAAVWFACYAGCDPVILMGMDCYQGEKEYFTDEKPGPFQSSGRTITLEKHLDVWRDAFKRCPDPHVIKAAAGPLVEIFGKWEPPSKGKNREKDLIKKRMTR